MRLVVADPDVSVITFDDMDKQLKLDGVTTEQELIEGYIDAVVEHLDGADGWLGRNLSRRQVDLYMSAFVLDDGCGGSPVTLPLGPVGDIDLIEYRDPSTGAWSTVDPAIYEMRGDVLTAAWMQQWPAVAIDAEAIHVRYEAGYTTLPKPIRAAIILMVGDLYENRTTVAVGMRAAAVAIPMPTTVEVLLAPYRGFI